MRCHTSPTVYKKAELNNALKVYANASYKQPISRLYWFTKPFKTRWLCCIYCAYTAIERSRKEFTKFIN